MGCAWKCCCRHHLAYKNANIGVFNISFGFLNGQEPIQTGGKMRENAPILSAIFDRPFPERRGAKMGRAVDLDRLRFGVVSNKSKRRKNRGDGQHIPERLINI